jgi:Protein of unknown function (DUF4236)
VSLRFRRSIKLAPGVRMNFSGSGISWTLGPRGASVGIGKRGTYLNSGIAGTGLYSRERLSESGSSSRPDVAAPHRIKVELTACISDSGDIYFNDSEGKRVSEQVMNIAKKQKGDLIKKLIQIKCNEINGEIEALGELHLHTPDANQSPRFEVKAFQGEKPIEPRLKSIGFLAKIFASIRRNIEHGNKALLDQHAINLQKWAEQKASFEQWENARYRLVHEDIYQNTEAMARYLEIQLLEVVWPRETIVTFDIVDDGKIIMLDVDLPEYEHMPTKLASIPQRGYRLSIKEMGERKVRQLYVDHIHSIGFRLIGEAFAALPTIQSVVFSGYSQRPDSGTGQIKEEYLYSARVNRQEWLKINFEKLNTINVVDAIGRFECQRDISKTGLMKPILPIEASIWKM